MLDIQNDPRQWTHDPIVGPWDYSCDEYGVWHHSMPDGWEALTILREAPRCGLDHPDHPNEPHGSCGGAPEHEHPHMWCQYGYQIISVTRKSKVTVGV